MRYFFGKHQRVVDRNAMTRALHQGVCVADGTLVLFVFRTATDQPAKLGVTIPKKAGNAVARNRWKRLIRESFRTQQHEFPTGYDFVFRPKKGAKPDWSEIQRSVPRLALKGLTRLRSQRPTNE